MIFQWFLVIFGVIALTRTWKQYERAHVSRHWLWIWAIIWIGVIVVAWSPKASDTVANYIGVGRGADLFVYLAIIALLYGFSRMIMTQEKQRQELTELVRKIAIEHAQNGAAGDLKE